MTPGGGAGGAGVRDGGADVGPVGTGGVSGGSGGRAGSAGAGGAAARSLATIVDERPVGGASLQNGTTGGGAYAVALAAGNVVNVTSGSQFLSAVAGTTPKIILIAAGTYDFKTMPTTVQVCHVACNPTTPVAFEATGSFFCPAGSTLLNTSLTSTKVTVGSNKTIIGLGAGATLKNLEINLSNSSNIIMRNLTLSDINPGILDQGDALLLWPSDHVWVDHCTFVNASHSFLNIASGWDAAGNLTTLTGYMTFSWNKFLGTTTNSCGGRTHFAIGTNRNPGLTFHHNWIDDSNGRNPSLFGPFTWVHMFDNYLSTITYYGVSALCGASTLLEGNAFSKVSWAIYNNDGGAPTYSYCHTGYFGNVYAPLNDATYGARNNLLDTASTTNLGGQTTFSSAVAVPTLVSGLTYKVTVPAAPGFAATSYTYTLDANPSTVATTVPAGAGVGHLF
jgi:pectate lyase